MSSKFILHNIQSEVFNKVVRKNCQINNQEAYPLSFRISSLIFRKAYKFEKEIKFFNLFMKFLKLNAKLRILNMCGRGVCALGQFSYYFLLHN